MQRLRQSMADARYRANQQVGARGRRCARPHAGTQCYGVLPPSGRYPDLPPSLRPPLLSWLDFETLPLMSGDAKRRTITTTGSLSSGVCFFIIIGRELLMTACIQDQSRNRHKRRGKEMPAFECLGGWYAPIRAR